MKLALESCTVDLERKEVLRGDASERLTVKEAALLAYLAARPGRSVDQDELLREVWGYRSGVVTRTVRTTVSRLRAKIEADPSEPAHLVTEYGEGYRFRPSAGPPASTNLGAEVDRFFGRDDVIKALHEAFAGDRRLVTVAGPPGMGKTRLARRFGAERVAQTPGGVWFCDLSEATTAVGVARAVADVLGVAMGGAPVDEVGRALAMRAPILVLLDNFEQAVHVASDTVGRWLTGAPGVHLLVTSREVLRLRGESVLELAPLPVPQAAQLFVARARQRALDLDLAADDEAVLSVVTLLDGIPLAIELAASWAGVVSVKELHSRFADRLAALGTTLRDVGARHRTLRTALDASWELLSDGERDAFARCAVFRGGFTARAAAGVLDLPEPEALDRVRALVDKSLVRSGGDRYAMFESTRAYASDKLRGDEARDRHLAWFVAEGERLAAGLLGSDATASLASLSGELDNLVAAHDHALGTDPAAAARLALVMEPVLVARGPLPQHLAILEATRRVAPERPADVRVQLARAHGDVLRLLGRYDASARELEAAVAGDAGVEARVAALTSLAKTRVLLQDTDSARTLYGSALAAARAGGDMRGEAAAVRGLGNMRRLEGSVEQAIARYRQAADLFERAGDRAAQAWSLADVGEMLVARGEFEGAFDALHRALAILEADRNVRGVAAVRLRIGAALLQRDGPGLGASRALRQAVDEARRVGDFRRELKASWHLACVHTDRGELDEAEALLRRVIDLARHRADERIGHTARSAMALVLAERGAHTAAAELAHTALRSSEGRSEPLHVASNHLNAAQVCMAANDHAQACAHYLSAEAVFRDNAVDLPLAQALAQHGASEALRGSLPAAEALLAEVEPMLSRLPAGVRWCWEVSLGHVALARGETDEARRRLAAAAPRTSRSYEVRLLARLLADRLG